MILTKFKSLVEKHGHVRRDGRDYRGRCPAHTDDGSRGDLTFREEDGKLLVKCWHGCSTEEVVGAMNLTLQDLFVGNNGHGGNGHKPKRPESKSTRQPTAYPSIEAAGSTIAKRLRGRFTAHWTYTNLDGSEAFTVLRFDGCAGEKPKSYRPVHRNGTGYAEGDPPKPLVLYHLPELLADTASLVFVTEGEKATEAARSISLLATTSAHGAQSAAWTDWGALAGRDVVLLPDNDPNGRVYAEAVRDILLSLNPPAKVRIVMLPDVPEHGDIVEWMEAHDSAEPEALRAQILAMVEKARLEDKTSSESPAMEPIFVCMNDVTAKPVQWLWRDRIPSAMLSLLIGVEGKGKTFVVLDAAARITTGRPWPDAQGEHDFPLVGNVVFLTSEDHLEYTIRPRLDAAKADVSRVFALKGVKSPEGDEFFDIMQHLPALEVMVEKIRDVRLVVVDPLTAFLGAVDQHRNGEVRVALSRFSALAEKYGCAVVGISHLSKDTSRQAIHRTIGSVAFSAAARTVWLVSEDKEDQERRLFVPVKNNLAPLAKSLAFRIENMAVAWEAGQFDYQADEVLAVEVDGEDSGAKAEACQWLQSTLANGRVRSTEIWDAANKEKISRRTLIRAKAKLKAKSEKEGIGPIAVWYWRLP